MKKYIVSFLFSLLFISFFATEIVASTNKLFDSYGLNLGLNTFRLLGDLSSVQSQLTSNNNRLGGGLRFIEPGIDLSATIFIDSNKKHRLIVGGEYIWMNSREVNSVTSNIYNYSYHKVQFADFYLGYHYAFWAAPFQEVKIYSGAEIMLNNITLHKLDRGTVYESNPANNVALLYTKDPSTRIGGRIRAGFEGRLYQQIYINASFTLGIYNLLLRDDSTGELFNSPNSFEKKESHQPFFNYLLSFQYRFGQSQP